MPEEPLDANDLKNLLGITGDVVGTTDLQILTGKKFDDFLKVKPVATPSTDASYGIYYCDISDGKPKFKTTGGIVYDLSAAGTGEANTASNIGTAGTGIFKQKTGVNLELYKLNSIDTDLTIALDSGNNKIDFDLGANVAKTNVANVFTQINKFDKNIKVKPITEPSLDASYGSIYPDSADSNILKYKDPAGAVTALNVLPISPYNFFIYKDGSNYKAVNGSNGHVDFTNASFFTVMNSCVSALSGGGLIQLGVGDFTLTSQLVISTSGIRLKGLGVGVTRILYNMASQTTPGFIVAGSISANKALTANSAKSARTLTVASTTGIVADDWIYLVRNVLISDDDPNLYDAEIHQVESVTSTVITLKNKIYAAYNTADSARVNEITFVNDFGIEDLALVDVRATLTDMDGNADTIFRFCRRLTINNVKFENMVFGSCGIQNCYESAINNATFWFPRTLVGINYGLYIMSASTNTKVTNMTGIGCRHTITTGPIGGSQATTFGPGRQRGLQVGNSTSSLSNTADFDTHEGCVGAQFVNCGAIGGDIAGGLQTRTSGFNTRNPTTFIGCWTEGTYGQCAYVFSSDNNGATEEIPGGDETSFIGCHFRNTHPATGLDQTGIEIEGNRANVIISNCQFHNIPDKSILIGGGCSHITISKNQFIGCGTNNTTAEGIIHSPNGNLTDIIVTDNDFGFTPGNNTRPFVVVTGTLDAFKFTGNDVAGLDNPDISIPSTANQILIKDNIGLIQRGQGYSFFIEKVGSRYKAKDGNGYIFRNNSDLEALITGVFDDFVTPGVPVVIEFGEGDFTFDDQLSLDASRIGNITIKGQGMGKTNLIMGTGFNSLADGTTLIAFGEGADSSAGNVGTFTSNILKGTMFDLPMSAPDVAKFSIGDYVLIRSTAAWSTGATAVSKRGEIHKILDKPSSTTITLDVPLFDTYNTANTAVAVKLTNILTNITLKDLTVTQNGVTKDTQGFLYAAYCDNLVVENVEFIDPLSQFDNVTFTSCINSKFVNCRGVLNPTTDYNNQYFFVFRGCCQNCTAQGCTAIGDFRHVYEIAGQGGSDFEGPPRNNLFSHCQSQGGHVAAFGTHADGENNTFSDCHVAGTSVGYGFYGRSKGLKFLDCHVISPTGWAYALYEDANDALIDGCSAENMADDVYAIWIDPDINNAKISNCRFKNCGKAVIGINGADNAHIDITNCKFIDCGVNSASTNGLIETGGYVSQLNIIGNDFSASSTSAHPIDFGTNAVDGFLFANNDCNGFANPLPRGIPAASGYIRVTHNIETNPINKITNAVDSTNHVIAWYGGNTGAVVASQDYLIEGSDVLITSTGGTGVSITIKDGGGNTVASGLTTLAGYHIPNQYKINFGAFSGAPTVTVFGE